MRFSSVSVRKRYRGVQRAVLGRDWHVDVLLRTLSSGGSRRPLAFRADSKKLPAVVGVDNGPGGYALVQVTKVIEPEKIDESQRAQLSGGLRDAVASADFEATLGSLRDRVGVSIRSGALDAKPK